MIENNQVSLFDSGRIFGGTCLPSVAFDLKQHNKPMGGDDKLFVSLIMAATYKFPVNLSLFVLNSSL